MHSLSSIESVEPNYRSKIPIVKYFCMLRVTPAGCPVVHGGRSRNFTSEPLDFDGRWFAKGCEEIFPHCAVKGFGVRFPLTGENETIRS